MAILLGLVLFSGCSSTNYPHNGIRDLPEVPKLSQASPPARLPASPLLPTKPDAEDKKDPKKEENKDVKPVSVETKRNARQDGEGSIRSADDSPSSGSSPTNENDIIQTAFAEGKQEPTLPLEAVLDSVSRHFPLMLAVFEERGIADGQRLTAEGAFDAQLRTRVSQQAGSFPSTRAELGIEQPTPIWGVSVFSAYRYGQENFPLYYGDRLTADGGEFRGGISIPFLRDGAIDRRRAVARQAEIQRSLAEPTIQRARIEFYRSAARAYWNWIAAGGQVLVAEDLLRIARDRQSGLETQFEKGQISEFVVIDNRRAVVEREGAYVATERRYQQAAFELSMFYRDSSGNPRVPTSAMLPSSMPERTDDIPDDSQLTALVDSAARLRPELRRIHLQKERLVVDQQLAENQTLPNLNAVVVGSQDVGKGKKGTGTSALDRTSLEAAIILEVPLQRRDAFGRLVTTRSQMSQLLQQERFSRDQIMIEVQDAISNLDRTKIRISKAREESKIAERVAALEVVRFQRGQSSLLEVNLRELAVASARTKIIDAIADFQRAKADLRAALGVDSQP